MAKRPHFLQLHSACGDSREILINVDHIVAIHGSFDPDDRVDDMPCYEVSVIVTDAIGQEVSGHMYRTQEGGIYKVNESIDTIWDKIYS